MVWSSSIGTMEVVLILLFGLFYIIYIYKTIFASKYLGSTYQNIFYKVFLRTFYFFLFVVALLGPSFGDTTKEIKSIGKDIFIVLDLSISMNASDIQPTRLEKLKFELKNIVEAFNSDRIGLIIFSGEAFVQCPLTYDKSALNIFIETLNTNLVPDTGTDFGLSLKMALEKITNEKESVTRKKSKIILLISDGEDFGEQTDEIAKDIEESGIKLFTLGIGTAKGSKIITRRGFKKDKNRQDIITKLHSTSLKKLAANTNGKYFEINESQNDVSKLINAISSIEGELRDSKKLDVSSNKYYFFLVLALALMALDVLIKIKTLTV